MNNVFPLSFLVAVFGQALTEQILLLPHCVLVFYAAVVIFGGQVNYSHNPTLQAVLLKKAFFVGRVKMKKTKSSIHCRSIVLLLFVVSWACWVSLETEAKDGKVLASRNDINGKKIASEVMNIIMKIIHM